MSDDALMLLLIHLSIFLLHKFAWNGDYYKFLLIMSSILLKTVQEEANIQYVWARHSLTVHTRLKQNKSDLCCCFPYWISFVFVNLRFGVSFCLESQHERIWISREQRTNAPLWRVCTVRRRSLHQIASHNEIVNKINLTLVVWV